MVLAPISSGELDCLQDTRGQCILLHQHLQTRPVYKNATEGHIDSRFGMQVNLLQRYRREIERAVLDGHVKHVQKRI